MVIIVYDNLVLLFVRKSKNIYHYWNDDLVLIYYVLQCLRKRIINDDIVWIYYLRWYLRKGDYLTNYNFHVLS